MPRFPSLALPQRRTAPTAFRNPSSIVLVLAEAGATGLLHHAGQQPVWRGERVAIAGSEVWRSVDGQVVVAGDLMLDNLPELRALLGLPEVEAGEAAAECFRRFGAAGGAERLLGMFALAVWDGGAETLTLVRDAAGARTIYYAGGAGQWWAATRLMALRRTPAVSTALSLAALRDYLTCAFVPGGQTMWRDAHEVRPGTLVTLPGGTTHTWWRPPAADPEAQEPLETHAARLRPLLEDAVRRRLPPRGEPVAAFLSGGLDSSLVTALATRLHNAPVHTFSIHFGAQRPNELAWSSLVAEHCGSRHHIIELPGRLIRDRLMETMAALDDPIGDPLTVPNLVLAEQAADVARLVLNGEGGDPCFGGPKNGPMLLHELYGGGHARTAAYFRSYQKCYDDLPNLLTTEMRRALDAEPDQEELLTPFFSDGADDAEALGLASPSLLDRLLLINIRLKGADHILTKVNNLYGVAGVTGRAPLFDRRLMEAGFTIPPQYKMEGAVEKAVLKRAVADLLPEAIIARPKSGMLVPVQAWFRDELRTYARAMLLSKDARIRPYLQQPLLKEWLSYQGNLFPRHGVKLWLVLALELWLRAQD